MSDDFYARLPPLQHFADITDPARYTPLPDDWLVVVTDVEGSTAAVQAGHYRDVNYVGAASIAAVLNLAGETKVPFVFGGDGATLVVPPSLLERTQAALSALRVHARDTLGLALRVGVVPVADVRAEGYGVRVAPLAVSENYTQAMFTGGGLAHADRLVKSPVTGPGYAVTGDFAAPEGDLYEGLECRWQDIRGRSETVTILVSAIGDDPAAHHAVYREVVEAIERIYGPGTTPHPVALDRLRLSWDPRLFAPEVRLRTPRPDRFGQRLKLWALNVLGMVLIRFRLKTSETDWGRYPALLRDASDYRKFDDTLRMVLAGTPAQRRRLEDFLDRLYRRGEVAYGIHVSDRAVVTCLVHERMGQQVHFVDGAGGGYTAAATDLKRRTRTLPTSA
ncbi:MAG: DUF3095 domain-containing protein [Bacteroidota bacterium]